MGVKMFDRADPSQKQTEIFQDISGGVNTEIADEAMPDNQRRAIVNLDIDSGGYAKKRPGLHRIPWITTLIWSKLNTEYQNGNIDDLTSLLVTDVYMFYDGANYIVNYITNKGLVVLILTSDMMPVNTNSLTGDILSDDVEEVQPVQFYKDILYNVRISDYSTQFILVSSVYRITPDYTITNDEKQVRYYSWCPIQDPNGPNQLTKGWVEACEQDETPISQTFYGEIKTITITTPKLNLVSSADLVKNFYIGDKYEWTDDSDFYYYLIDSDGLTTGYMVIYCKDVRNDKIIWQSYITNRITGDYITENDVYNVYISVDENGTYPYLVIAYTLKPGKKTISINRKPIEDDGLYVWPNTTNFSLSANIVVDRFTINNTGISGVDNFPKWTTTTPLGLSASNLEIYYTQTNGFGTVSKQSSYNTGNHQKFLACGSLCGDNSTPFGTQTLNKTNRSYYIEDDTMCLLINMAGTNYNVVTLGVLWDYSKQSIDNNIVIDDSDVVDTDHFYNSNLSIGPIGIVLVDNIKGRKYIGGGADVGSGHGDLTKLFSSSITSDNNPIVRFQKSKNITTPIDYSTDQTAGSAILGYIDSGGCAPNGGEDGPYFLEGYINSTYTNDDGVEMAVDTIGSIWYQSKSKYIEDNSGLNNNNGLTQKIISKSQWSNSVDLSIYDTLKSTTTGKPNYADANSYVTTLPSSVNGKNTTISNWSAIDATGPNLGDLYQSWLYYWSKASSISYDVLIDKNTMTLQNAPINTSIQYNGFKGVTFCLVNKGSQTVLAYKPNPISFFKVAPILKEQAMVKTFNLSDFFNKDDIMSVVENKYNIVDFSLRFYYKNDTISQNVDFGLQDYDAINFAEDLISITNWNQPLVYIYYCYLANFTLYLKVVVRIPTNDPNVFKEIELGEFEPASFDINTIVDGNFKLIYETIIGTKADNPSLFTQQQYTIPNINDFSYLWYNLGNFNVRVTGLTPDVDDPTVYPFLPPELVQYPTTESADSSPFIVSSIIPVNSIILKPGDDQRFQVFWAENQLPSERRKQLWVNWYIGSMDDYNTMITQDDYSTSNSLNWVELKSGQSGDTSTFVSTTSLETQNNSQGQKVWYADLNIPVSNQILLIQFNMIGSYDEASDQHKATDRDPATYRSTSLQLDPASTTQTRIDVPSIFDEFVATNKLITYRSSLVSYGKTNKLFFSEISNPTYFPLKWVLEMPTNEAVTCCTIFQNQLVVSTANQKFYVSGVSFDDQDNPFEIHAVTQEAGAVNDQCEHSFQDRLFFHDSGGFKALKNLYSTTEKEFNYVTMDTNIKSLIPSDKTGVLIVTLEDKLYIHYPSNKSMIIYNAKLDNFTTYQSDIMNFNKMYVVNGKLYCISGAQGMGSDMFKIWYFDKDTYVDDWNPEEDGYETVLIPFENNIAHRIQKGVWFECYLKTKNLDLEYPYHWKKLNEITVTTASDQLTTIVQPEIEFDSNRVNYSLSLYRDITGKLVYQIDNPNTIIIRTGTKVDNTWILGKNKLGDQEVTQHQMNVGRASRTFALGLRHKYPLPITFMNFNVRYGILKNRANTSRKIS